MSNRVQNLEALVDGAFISWEPERSGLGNTFGHLEKYKPY